MKIVYTFKAGGSKHRDVELRWSLRSVARWHKGALPDIVIVGDEPPEFVDRTKLTFLPHANDCPHKHDNLMAHLLHAIDTGVCTSPFLWSSDDHFFVKEADFDNYPVWVKNAEVARECDYGPTRITKFHRSLIDTRNILEEFGLPVMTFSGHFNTWIDPDDVPAVNCMLAVTPRGRYGYEPAMMFLNAKLARLGEMDCQAREDMKLKEFKTEENLVKEIGNRDSFSISDSVLENRAFCDMMWRWYPEPSPWEVK